MPPTKCAACDFSMDEADNFCRRCGVSVGQAGLPVAREPASVTVWKPQTSPVIKGAAVMAAGTLGQFVVRRVIGSLIGGNGKGRRRSIFPTRRQDDGLLDEAQIITETVMLRRVRIRRQA